MVVDMACLPADDLCALQQDYSAYIREIEQDDVPTQAEIPTPDGRVAYIAYIDGDFVIVIKDKEN